MASHNALGQGMYGKQYKEYNYFIVKHAVSVNDPRGDQVGEAVCGCNSYRERLCSWCSCC